MERNINLSEERKCEICGEYKPIKEFSKSYPHRCKSCVAEHARLSRKEKKIRPTIKDKIDWEARRFELIKTALAGILSDPECVITTDELANNCVSIADAIIAKMKGGQDEQTAK